MAIGSLLMDLIQLQTSGKQGIYVKYVVSGAALEGKLNYLPEAIAEALFDCKVCMCMYVYVCVCILQILWTGQDRTGQDRTEKVHYIFITSTLLSPIQYM